ncbi:MAG: transcriptional regulator [Methanobrevibacter sp.]|nr:transcriptional regulator [Methanobrevibacter sp.]
MDDETLKVYGYVNISTYRARAVKALEEGEKTPTNIAKDSGIKINHISNVLRQLKECQVAECLNEEAHKNRIYRLTDVGQEVAKHLDNL